MHPLPENVSRASTFDIVERVRCEVYDGLRSFRPYNDDVKRIIDASTIGYDFKFVITEKNGAGMEKAPANLKFERPSFKDPKKGFTLDLTASAEKTRTNNRKFRIVEELKEIDNLDCSNATTRANWVYPITGATGMAEVVRTYIRLEAISNFAPVVKFEELGTTTFGTTTLGTTTIVFSDVLNFNTALTGGASPKLLLTAVAGDFRLTNASFAGTASRTDEHNVIVALANDRKKLDAPPSHGMPVPKRPHKPGVAGGAPANDRKKSDAPSSGRPVSMLPHKLAVASAQRETLINMDLVADSRTVTALVQNDVDSRNRVILELQRLRNLEDDDDEAPRLLGKRLLELMRVP